ncbi:MAG: helix-turn-helix domain-containing protein [Thermoleophilaceae bacterium]|nr:helix-turn-helix domain-containing protein [Thermoleophilaceae bacterium]
MSAEISGRASRPWERLSEASASLMESHRRAIAEEILTEVAREIPAYTRPLEGAFGVGLRGGVEQALMQFVAMARDPDTSLREEGRRVYVALGRGEVVAGRSIGALLAAYRLGAQVAWRHLADASIKAGLDQRESNLLAEAIFAYIDELSAESAEGYAQAQAERAGEIDARRSELIDLLTRGTLGLDPRALAAAAEAANWTLPSEVAVLTWREDLGRAPAGRLPQNSILRGDETQYVALIPEPRNAARREQLLRAFSRIPSGLGSCAELRDARHSYNHSRAMLSLGEDLNLPGIVAADDHRPTLIANSDRLLAEEIVRERLSPLDEETPASRERLTATLLAWLRNNGGITAAAEELHVHPQTARYRMARLGELLGDDLDDPELRYELEFALRATRSWSSSQVLRSSPPA